MKCEFWPNHLGRFLCHYIQYMYTAYWGWYYQSTGIMIIACILCLTISHLRTFVFIVCVHRYCPSLNFSRLLLLLTWGERHLKALGDNAVPWFLKFHMRPSVHKCLDKTKLRWTSIISASLPTICKIYKKSLKLCSGPLFKTAIRMHEWPQEQANLHAN